MPDGIRFDASEVEALARHFTAEAAAAPELVRGAVAKGSLNIKTDWRREWSNLASLPHIDQSITYDTRIRGLTVTGEIGPEHGKRQAELAHFPEHGSLNNAPHPGGAPALARERPRFEKALEDLAVKQLEGR